MNRTCSLLLGVFLAFVAFVGISPAQTVSFYQTTPDLAHALEAQPSLAFGSSGSGAVTITIDDGKTYQTMDGFGASFTDSSAWLIYTKLSPAQRTAAMLMLFDRTQGIALSFLRQPMGSSDLARTFYSYDDLCTQTATACTSTGVADANLAQFSIAHDQEYILPVLQQAIAMNRNIKVMATPWSPPGWMKTNGTMLGVDAKNVAGSLRSDAYTPLANYFVKFVQAYEAAGVPITYLSIQNEPLYTPNTYSGMAMTSGEQANFLGTYLGPALASAGLHSKVMVYDHNWDQWSYATAVLNDATANSFAVGSAFHHYAGNPSVMSTVHDLYPSKGIWETEASGGTWQSGNILAQEGLELINSARNWAKSYVLWNIALDQDHGPYVGGCNTCRGLLTVDWSDTNNVTFKPELDYYVLGHASKFLQPGAVRVDSDQATANGIYDVAFRNPDGSMVVYALNNGATDQTFNVKQGANVFTATVKAGSLATFTWAAATPPVVSLSAEPNGMSLAAGKTGSISVDVQALMGSGNVSLTCSGASATMSCTITPNSLTFSSTAVQTVEVAVTTTARTTATVVPTHRRSVLFGWALLPMLGICAIGRRRKWLSLVLFSAALVLMTSCGGGSGGGGTTPPPIAPPSGTKAGTYPLTVTATPSSGPAVSLTLYVTVQ